MRPTICAVVCIGAVMLAVNLQPGNSGLYALALVPGVSGGLLSRRVDWFSSYTNNVLVGAVGLGLAATGSYALDPGDDGTWVVFLMTGLMLFTLGAVGGVLVGPVVWLVWGRTGSSEEC